MKKEKNLETILGITVALSVLSLVLKLKLLILISIIICLTTLSSAWGGEKIAKLWTGFWSLIGTLISRIALFIIFYILLCPLAILRKIFGRSPAKLNTDSLYIDREHLYLAKDLENTW